MKIQANGGDTGAPRRAWADQIEGEDMESTVIYKEVTADNADRNDGV